MRITEVDQEVTQSQLNALESVLDRVFKPLGIDVEFTRHFLDRVNDERNVKQITISELAMLFKKEYQKWGKPIAQLGPDAEAVMKDMSSDINVPFALDWNRDTGMLELVAKTVMRKKNFRTPNKEFPVESRLVSNKLKESVIMESGSMPGVGPIHRDEIEPTLQKLEKELGVPLVNNALGSVGKKQFSGDMDVALKIDAKDIPAFIEKLKQNKNILDLTQTSVIITKIRIENYDANRTFIDPKTNEDKGVPEGRTGFVQLDFMPGDPDWLKTYYHAPHETDSKYKGVYRNIMIASIAANFDRDDSPETLPDGRSIESKRYMWSGKDGLVRISRTPKPKAKGDGYTKANINKIIAGPWKDPDDIARQLKLDSAEDIYSFETLLAAIKKNYGQELINRIVKDFATNSQIQQMGVPDELNQE